MALIGNTVTLQAEFANESGFRYEVQDVALTIYDERKRVILTVPEAELEQVSVGVYRYDYIVPEGATPYYYEFSGIWEGKRLTGRLPLIREWT